jgi:hypothetical protein
LALTTAANTSWNYFIPPVSARNCGWKTVPMIVPQHNCLAAIDIDHRQSRHLVLTGAANRCDEPSTLDA